MSNEELRAIWQAIMDTQHPCCLQHSNPSRDNETEEGYIERTDWEQAVFTTMEQRNLPTEREQPEPLTCPTCGTKVETQDGTYGDMYAVCRRCKTYRQFGDHMDCSLGPIVPGLPEL